MQIGDGKIFGRSQHSVAGDVADEIDPSERAIDLPKQVGHRVGVGDVRAGDERLATQEVDLFRRGFRAGDVAVDERHVRSVLRERQRRRTAKTLRGSGDDGDFAGKIEQRIH